MSKMDYNRYEPITDALLFLVAPTLSPHDKLAAIQLYQPERSLVMDDSDEQAETSEATCPAVHVAYDFVGPSYASIMQRLDAVNSHLETLQTFAASITLAAPILAASVVKDVDFRSPWFLSAFSIFMVVIVIGAVARVRGSLQLITPQSLYDDWLHYSEWEFKKNAIYWAGQHFKANRSLVNNRAHAAFGMTVLLLLEMGLLLAWVVTQV